MPGPSTPSTKSLKPAVVGACVGALIGTAGGFWVGRALPDEKVIEQRVEVALRSGESGAGRPRSVSSGPGADSKGARTVALDDDLRVSLRAVFAITDPMHRIEAIRGIVRSLPRARWSEFLEAFEKMAEDQEFEDNPNSMLVALGTFETVISEIAAQAPQAFLTDWLARDPPKSSDNGFVGVLRCWAARDTGAAVAFFDRTIRPLRADQQGGMAGALAREFVKKDADAAFAWIKSLPTEQQGGVARDAFQTLSHVDSAKAASILVGHDEIPNRGEVAAAIAVGWARTEPAKAFEWAAALPGELSTNALGAAAAEWAQHDYTRTLERVSQLDPALRASCLPGLAAHAPDSEIPAFAARLRSEAESDDRATAAAGLVGRWAQKDPTAASEWLADQPAGPTRDGAIKGFAGQLLESDPASAFEWAAVMANRDERGLFLDNGIKQWAEKDPAAARQWVLSSQRLSSDDREKLLVRTGR